MCLTRGYGSPGVLVPVAVCVLLYPVASLLGNRIGVGYGVNARQQWRALLGGAIRWLLMGPFYLTLVGPPFELTVGVFILLVYPLASLLVPRPDSRIRRRGVQQSVGTATLRFRSPTTGSHRDKDPGCRVRPSGSVIGQTRWRGSRSNRPVRQGPNRSTAARFDNVATCVLPPSPRAAPRT